MTSIVYGGVGFGHLSLSRMMSAAGLALASTLPAFADDGLGIERDWPSYASACVSALADVMEREPSLQIVMMCSCQEEAAALYGKQGTYDLLAQGRIREVSDHARFSINPTYTQICTGPDGEEDTPYRAETRERAEAWWEENGT